MTPIAREQLHALATLPTDPTPAEPAGDPEVPTEDQPFLPYEPQDGPYDVLTRLRSGALGDF